METVVVDLNHEHARRLLEDLQLLADIAANGAYKPIIDRSYPLENAAEAHAYVDQGHKRGSVVSMRAQAQGEPPEPLRGICDTGVAWRARRPSLTPLSRPCRFLARSDRPRRQHQHPICWVISIVASDRPAHPAQ